MLTDRIFSSEPHICIFSSRKECWPCDNIYLVHSHAYKCCLQIIAWTKANLNINIRHYNLQAVPIITNIHVSPENTPTKAGVYFRCFQLINLTGDILVTNDTNKKSFCEFKRHLWTFKFSKSRFYKTNCRNFIRNRLLLPYLTYINILWEVILS